MSRPMKAEQAEIALVGALLMEGGAALDVSGLDGDSFFDPRHRRLWEAAQRLHRQGKPAGDQALLAAELGDSFAAMGAYSWLSTLAQHAGSIDAAHHYADRILEAQQNRDLALRLSEVLRGDDSGDSFVAAAAAAVSGVKSRRRDRTVTIGEAVTDVVRATHRIMDARERGEAAVRGVPTGFAQLDRFTGGIQRGKLTVLAARPSMGKSSAARTFADCANVAGVGVHVFSAEDDVPAYARRALADAAGVDLSQVGAGVLNRHELAAFVSAGERLRERKGWIIDDSTGIGSTQISTLVRKHKSENNTGLVVVDYLQLLREKAARPGDRKAAVDLALDGLCDLARTENMAMLVLSQLNRQCEERDDKRPQLSDLRESGEIEQAADVVVFIHRPGRYDADADQTVGEFIIAKNKSGPTGKIGVRWTPATATYSPIDEMTARRAYGSGSRRPDVTGGRDE